MELYIKNVNTGDVNTTWGPFTNFDDLKRFLVDRPHLIDWILEDDPYFCLPKFEEANDVLDIAYMFNMVYLDWWCLQLVDDNGDELSIDQLRQLL